MRFRSRVVDRSGDVDASLKKTHDLRHCPARLVHLTTAPSAAQHDGLAGQRWGWRQRWCRDCAVVHLRQVAPRAVLTHRPERLGSLLGRHNATSDALTADHHHGPVRRLRPRLQRWCRSCRIARSLNSACLLLIRRCWVGAEVSASLGGRRRRRRVAAYMWSQTAAVLASVARRTRHDDHEQNQRQDHSYRQQRYHHCNAPVTYNSND